MRASEPLDTRECCPGAASRLQGAPNAALALLVRHLASENAALALLLGHMAFETAAAAPLLSHLALENAAPAIVLRIFVLS